MSRSQPKRQTNPDLLPKLEWAFALGATGLILILHVVLLFHAGGLWRDEVNTVELASMPSLADTWNHLQYDSFPMLWFLVLRAWMKVAASDFALRILGCLIGTGIVGMLWVTARRFKVSTPLFSLTLLALSPAMFRSGDSLRAYGFGVLLFLVTLNSVWAMMKSPTRRNIIIASITAILSVHALFYNAVLLLALGCAGIFVCLRQGRRRDAAILLGIGIAAAVTLLPYAGTIKGAAEWNMLVHIREYTLSHFFKKFSYATGPVLVWFWVGLTIAAVVSATLLRSKQSPDSDESADVVRFGGAMLLVGAIAYFVFLKILQYHTQVWYYVSLMALVAVALDLVFVNRTTFRCRALKLALAVVIAALNLPGLWRHSQTRFTAVDLVAQHLQKEAGPNDFILVNPWYFSIPFQRYYHGSTPWETVPPLDDFKFHRFDLVKEIMKAPTQVEVVEPLFGRIRETLSSGNTVWICGGMDFLEPGQTAQAIPPAPHPEFGWDEGLYTAAWALQTGLFLQQHLTDFQWIDFTNQSVAVYESPSLGIARGWRP